jgi:predicted amidohydrolase
VNQSSKFLIFLIFFVLLNACASVHRTDQKNGAAVIEEYATIYPVREVLFSGQKGLTIGLANLKNYTNIEDNKAKIIRVIDQLKPYHVDMIIFPEFSLTGYFWSTKGREDSEECWKYMNSGVLDKHLNWLKTSVKSRLDDRLKYIIFNAIRENPTTAMEQGSRKKFLNSTYVIDKTFNCDDLRVNGNTHIYDKTFLPGIEKVYSTTPGTDFLVINNKDGNRPKYWKKIGFTTCYDMCFSQLYQEYASVHDVQAIMELASWRATGSGEYGKRAYNLACKACDTCEWKPCKKKNYQYYGFQWDLMASDRAATNQIWLIAANAVGRQEKGGYEFWGGSGVWAPSGIKIVEASHEKEELLVVRNLPIEQDIDSEREKFDYQDDFQKVYRPIPHRCCNSSDCCSSENCCGSFTRFE